MIKLEILKNEKSVDKLTFDDQEDLICFIELYEGHHTYKYDHYEYKIGAED